MSTMQSEYRQFAWSCAGIPLFLQPWWLDACSGPSGWDAVVVTSGGTAQAGLPFVRTVGRRSVVLGMPKLTPVLGPWFSAPGGKSGNRLAIEKDLIGELLDRLPPCDSYSQNWHHSMTNWLPAYWRGYEQTTRYTYRIPSLSNLDAVWAGMQSNIRTDVRKAEGRFGVVVDQNASLEEFLGLQDKTFARQGRASPYAREFLGRVDAAASSQGVRRIFVARDPTGQPHAGVYLVWDERSAYYLMGGGDPELRSSGATSLCLWQAIRFASTVTASFDFEGSMMEPVERLFRAFGAEQTPYFAVSRMNSWQLRARLALREIFGKGQRA
jgi:hypothetical protein